MRTAALTIGLTLAWLAGAASAQVAPERNWRGVATARDRDRLREWRTAWVTAVAAAREGDGAAAIAADPTLFDPDRALPMIPPPAGAYRCRAVKLGGTGVTQGFVQRPWGDCRVEVTADGLRLSRSSGVQRPTGIIFPDTDGRAVFLGVMVLSDELRPLPYGRDHARDLAGIVERIGRQRWRVALPYPQYESTLDLVELEPAVS